MKYKEFIASAMVFTLLASAVGCDDKKNTDDSITKQKNTSSESVADITEETTEELIPPVPIEATDVNSVTFDDDNFSFAQVISDDDSANGELSIVEVQGNKMLKFTDLSEGESLTSELVHKVRISAIDLIGAENLDKVKSIEFDLYADATSDKLVTENGENVKAPGWIGGGGGTVDANEKWYDFSEFSSEEYNFDMSGACHVTFKFLLADSGQKWSNEMTDANFVIMRWGLQNHSNTYIDNITFYDNDGNSIPLADVTATETESEVVETEEIRS